MRSVNYILSVPVDVGHRIIHPFVVETVRRCSGSRCAFIEMDDLGEVIRARAGLAETRVRIRISTHAPGGKEEMKAEGEFLPCHVMRGG